MRLGRDTGSMVNYLLSGTNGAPKPAVGMGVTILHWTDRSAGTISWVSPSGKSFRYRGDEAIRTDKHGMSESQSYDFKPRPDAPEATARLTKSGHFKSGGYVVRVGDRDAYYDYTF